MRDERGRVAAGMRGVVLAVAVLTLATGCIWQQQTLSRADIVGTWTEGDTGTGTLHFKDDGTVVVTNLAVFSNETDNVVKVSECSGTGTWWLYPDDKEAQKLGTSVCDGSPWEFGGSKAHPKMRALVGDPSYGKYQTLSRE
ncbi:hypothetical protein [Streptomyces mesophilus]|uniref:hypothetical protein n=1 Tax=Streptomyces mesophilus TaxID=1775132 RepID=UPI0033283B14